MTLEQHKDVVSRQSQVSREAGKELPSAVLRKIPLKVLLGPEREFRAVLIKATSVALQAPLRESVALGEELLALKTVEEPA